MATAAGPPADVLEHRYQVPGHPITVYPPTKSKPYHQIVYVEDGVRRVASGGKTIDSAERKVNEIVERLDNDAPSAVRSVRELMAVWSNSDRPRPTPWSLKYETAVHDLNNRYVIPALGSRRCQDLTRDDVQRTVDQAPSRSAGDRIKRQLSAAFNWGYRNGYLATPPVKLLGDVHWMGNSKGMDKGRIPVGISPTTQGESALFVSPDKIPTHEAIADLTAGFLLLPRAEVWWALFPMVAAYSGLRLGELLALRASDVDTGKRRIRVERQLIDIGVRQEIGPPKRNKHRVTLYPARTPQTQWFPDGFDLSHHLRRRVEQVRDTDAADGLLFPAPRGGFYSQTNFYGRRFHPAAKTAKWPTQAAQRGSRQVVGLKWKWHSLRHVFCSYYLWDLHATPADVSMAAGHGSVDITLRIYASNVSGALDRMSTLA